MLQPVRESPCWVLTHEIEDPTEEGIGHYITETEALRALWQERAWFKRECDPDDFPTSLLTSKPHRETYTCHLLVCDSCAHRLRWDEPGPVADGGTHYEPCDIDAILLADHGWSSDGSRHHCPNCPHLEAHDA